MRDLWRSTVSLLRQHPILWLPVIVVDITTYFLNWIERLLQNHLTYQFVSWLGQDHSVLSNKPVYAPPTMSVMMRVALLTAPLPWIARFLSIVLYTTAMLTTAAILGNIAEAENARPLLRTAASTVAMSRRRILGFSVKLLALFMASAVLAASLMVLGLRLQTFLETTPNLFLKFQLELAKLNLLGYAVALPLMIAIAFVITPIALRLLRTPDSVLALQETRRARIAAIHTVIVVAALGYFVPRTESSFLQQINPTSSLVVRLIDTTVSVFIALPYTVLYTVLYLIATPLSPLLIPSTQPDALPNEEDTPPAEETT
jgi:hypothetical protein